MTAEKFLKFMGVSALLHILLFLFMFSKLFKSLSHISLPPPAPAQTATITLIPAIKTPPPKAPDLASPNKRAFVDTSDLLKANKPDPSALFEGESNTRSASKTPGNGDPNLPNQKGRDSSLSLRESNYSPSNPQQAVVPTPEVADKQANKPPQPALTPQPVPDKPTTKQPNEVQPVTPRDEILKKGPEIHVATQQPKSAEPTPRTPPATASDNIPRSEPQAPSSVFSADRRLSDIRGGAALGPDSSVASQESELGRYKAKLYRAVGSRWYIYVQRSISQLSVGVIKVRFYVRANGVIDSVEVSSGDPRSMLATISKRSVIDVGAMEPFSPQMKEQLGEGYYEEISFSIY